MFANVPNKIKMLPSNIGTSSNRVDNPSPLNKLLHGYNVFNINNFTKFFVKSKYYTAPAKQTNTVLRLSQPWSNSSPRAFELPVLRAYKKINRKIN